ncbi:MAG: 6-bladed beta-propeller [Candidatus Aegiribacteria sp.]|nr:6-bladed beta-propeller [Candidatus Aegiribacteria sp.]
MFSKLRKPLPDGYIAIRNCAVAAITISSISCGGSDPVETIITLEQTMVIDGNADLNHCFTPINLSVDSEGKLFVLDFVSMKILVFSSEGDFLYEFGRPGEGPGEFHMLYFNFDIDESGHVYTINHPDRIEIFHNDGSYFAGITTDMGQIFDIAAVDTNRIYINGFPWGVGLINSTESPAVTLIDVNGEVIREIGHFDADMKNMSYGEKMVLMSCVIDTDDDLALYYSSAGDYRVNKYDSTGVFVWSVDGPCPFEAYFTDSNEGSTITPVIWDLDVEGDRVYVLWAQGGDERGYRVDVFSTDDGEPAGYFYTRTPSEAERNMFINVDGDDIYTVAYDDGIIYKYRMI